MENDIIYFSDFPNLQETGTRKDNGKFDLTLLPTQELKEEFRGYIMYRCKNGTLTLSFRTLFAPTFFKSSIIFVIFSASPEITICPGQL